jgi:hypothetical protein
MLPPYTNQSGCPATNNVRSKNPTACLGRQFNQACDAVASGAPVTLQYPPPSQSSTHTLSCLSLGHRLLGDMAYVAVSLICCSLQQILCPHVPEAAAAAGLCDTVLEAHTLPVPTVPYRAAHVRCTRAHASPRHHFSGATPQCDNATPQGAWYSAARSTTGARSSLLLAWQHLVQRALPLGALLHARQGCRGRCCCHSSASTWRSQCCCCSSSCSACRAWRCCCTLGLGPAAACSLLGTSVTTSPAGHGAGKSARCSGAAGALTQHQHGAWDMYTTHA